MADGWGGSVHLTPWAAGPVLVVSFVQGVDQNFPLHFAIYTILTRLFF